MNFKKSQEHPEALMCTRTDNAMTKSHRKENVVAKFHTEYFSKS